MSLDSTCAIGGKMTLRTRVVEVEPLAAGVVLVAYGRRRVQRMVAEPTTMSASYKTTV